MDLCKGCHELYMKRRKQDTMEIQQMKTQAKEERKRRKTERTKLLKEKKLREKAEKERYELEEYVKLLKEEIKITNHALVKKKLF